VQPLSLSKQLSPFERSQLEPAKILVERRDARMYIRQLDEHRLDRRLPPGALGSNAMTSRHEDVVGSQDYSVFP
jgi:hypothetical protein